MKKAIIFITLLPIFILGNLFSQNLIELPHLRTRFSKTFLDPMSGYLKYRTSTTNVHYIHNGDWEDIDNSIREYNSDYFTRDGSDLIIYFSKLENKVRFEIGDKWICIKLAGLTAWNQNQVVAQFPAQIPLAAAQNNLLRYSNALPCHKFAYRVFSNRISFQIVIANDILNALTNVSDLEYEFEVEYSPNISFNPNILPGTLSSGNCPVSFTSDTLAFFKVYHWLVKNALGASLVNQMVYAPLLNNRISVKSKISASHLLNSLPTDSTVIETIIYQAAVRAEFTTESDYYSANKTHSGSIVQWIWSIFTNYNHSLYPWVGRYDNFQWGSNEKYRAYHYWELSGIPSGSTIQQIEHFRVHVVAKEQGSNPSSSLSIDTRNLIFNDPNTTDYETFYAAISTGTLLDNRQYSEIDDEWNPGTITGGPVLQSIQSAINAGRDYFAIGLSHQGIAQDLLLQMEAGEDAWSYSLLITYQAPTNVSPVNGSIINSCSLSNYPNPFNSATNIVYQLPKCEIVWIRIYNVQGQIVRELTHQHVPAGNYRIIWDGRDNSGRPLASGVYWIRLFTPTFYKTIASVLTK